MERSASSLAASNNTLDESISLITAANQVVQNPEVVGNAMKTISMRIRGAKTEMEALGEDTEGMVDSTAKLRSEILALSGVDIMLDDNTFKSTYQIMDELAQKWKSLTDIQQASITELVAGKRQGNIMSSLMTNFDVARKSLETSLKSSGSAMREHEKASQSLEFKLNALKASWQSLSQTFLDSDFLKAGVDALAKFVDVIDDIIDRFGILGTGAGIFGLRNMFKSGFARDENGNQIGAYFGIFKGLSGELKTIGTNFKNVSGISKDLLFRLGALKEAGSQAGQAISESFKESKASLKVLAKDIAKVVVITNTIRAIQDIFSWISEAGKDAETTSEKFNRLSEELSNAESELNSLESEFSNVESQIDALLSKDELTYAEEEELTRLREISTELERQIQLTETLQESLNKSLSATAVDAYDEYISDTSFYSDKSKAERKEKGKSLGSSIGNIAGLIGGAALAAFTGGSSLIYAAVGSALGAGGGGLLGGLISNASYDSETTVNDMLDRLHVERTKLERAAKEATETYFDNPTDANKKVYEEATTALNDYNTALAEHIQKLSEYYNSMDYDTLDESGKQKYLNIGDTLDAYNIEMGVKGAKSTALDRIFSDEFIDEKANKGARDLKTAIQNAIDAGGKINYDAFDSEKFAAITNRLTEMGITIVDVIGYFKELEEAQAQAFDYDTYDIVSNVATLSDGVAALTDAFVEFNEQGVVSAKTLAELNEVFGSAGEAWTNYVDIMSNGISSIEDAREATEQLAETHLGNLFSNGGLRFATYDEETGNYKFDQDNYKTYLSTISELENLGVQNAKEYMDASQQRAMIEEAAAQMRNDSKQKQALLEKETLSEEEEILLNKLKSRDVNYYIQDIEDSYNVPLKNTKLLEQQYNLDEYNSILNDKKGALSELTNFIESYDGYVLSAQDEYGKYLESSDKAQALENQIVQDSIEHAKYAGDSPTGGLTWNDFEAIDDLFGTEWFDTDWDKFDQAKEDSDTYYKNYEEVLNNNKSNFDKMVEIADEYNINLDDIIPENMIDSDGSYNFDATADNAKEVFKQVYDRVKSELELSVDEYSKLADDLSSEIEAAYENLGLDIDFGRYFDKIVMDGFNTKVEQINTARAEMLSTGGLSTDSIMAIDEIFGDLNSYDSSKLFENTLNGVRLNTEEFRRLNNEFKNTNIDGLENKMSDLGDQYIKTREELYNLTYGTEEYNAKARELADIEAEMAANEELMSSYQGLFSAFQEWQRVESAGTERGMYETILGGFETVEDEISRGWVDDGTREFLELLKGDKATIFDGEGNAKEIDIATASAKELQQVWKGLDKDIEHTSYSVRDFFTVDEDGNSTSQGVRNFLDAIGQMEEEKFGGKDVVKRRGNEIIGFDFQLVGGDKAIAEALGVSEELVQIMKRAAIDAGFVVNFDGSYESLDVLKEKAEAAAKTMNEKLKEAGKDPIKIDMNVDNPEDIQSQIDEIMNAFGERDGNGKLTGAINMDVKGADEAVQVAMTLQQMMDKLSRPAYMNIQISQVEEDIREPLQQLQSLREYTEQEHLIKIKGGDTSKLEESKQAIYKYFEELDPEIKAKVGLVDDKGNGITKESFSKLTGEQKIELGYVDKDGNPIEDFSEAIRKKLNDGDLSIEATIDLQLEMAESLDILALTALKDNGLISDEEYVKRVNVYLEGQVDDGDAKEKTENAVDELGEGETVKKPVDVEIDTSKIKNLLDKRGIEEDHQVKILAMAEVFGADDLDELYGKLDGLTNKQIQVLAEVLGRVDVEKLKTTVAELDDKTVQAIAKALGEGDVEGLRSTIMGLDDKTVQAIAEAFGYSSVDELDKAIEGMDGKTVQAIAEALGITDVDSLRNAINRLTNKNVKATATTIGENKLKNLKSAIDKIKDKTVTITTKVKKFFTNVFGGSDDEGDGEVNGTANVNGTIGRAFKQGDWRTKRSETALTGELGREIVVTPQNRWYTVGDNGAEFVNIPRGSIVFNHRQTEELLRNGKATSDGGRARALVNGTALLGGTAHRGEGEWIAPEVKSVKVGYDYSASNSNSDSKKSQEIFDWIEVAIERIEREIDNLDKVAGNAYKSWGSKNEALVDQINMVGNEIALQQKAYQAYMDAANEIGLSSSWVKKIQNGEVNIENITDETLAEKIDDYRNYYEQALACKDAILKLQETESSLYAQRFENIQTQYDGILQGYEHTEAMLNEYITQAEEQGFIVSKKYYANLIANEKQNINTLKQEQSDLIRARDEAVSSGKIAKNSEEW